MKNLMFDSSKEKAQFDVAVSLGLMASTVPLILMLSGKINIVEMIKLTLCFLLITVISVLLSRYRMVRVDLNQDGLDIWYPLRKKKLFVRYSEIKEVYVPDLTFSLNIKLKNGVKITLPTIEWKSGEFTVAELTAADAKGPGGERIRLSREIESRVARINDGI